jgi:hypothetical protein
MSLLCRAGLAAAQLVRADLQGLLHGREGTGDLMNPSRHRWDEFSARAWTDDWLGLVEALGISYGHLHESDVNSRQLRKVVQAWANEHGWEHVEPAIKDLSGASGRRHWIATTPGESRDVAEVAWTEREAQEYRDAGWTVEGPFA